MQIHILYQNNSLRNYSYILECPQTKQAAVIDPLDAEMCLQFAKQHQLTITTIINTHEHWDHIAGNQKITQATQAEIVAHAHANIENVTHKVLANNIIKIGKTIQLRVLDTPGHTFTHICLLSINNAVPAFFSGDTLFNAGCGNCRSGDIQLLYKTFTEQLYLLGDHTQIYPGHDYLVNNLRFALTREPANPDIQHWLALAEKYDNTQPLITIIEIEKKINPFFRLHSSVLVQQLQQDFPYLSENIDSYKIFTYLRKLRNAW